MRRLIRLPFQLVALALLLVFAVAYWVIDQLYEGAKWAAGVLGIDIKEEG